MYSINKFHPTLRILHTNHQAAMYCLYDLIFPQIIPSSPFWEYTFFSNKLSAGSVVILDIKDSVALARLTRTLPLPSRRIKRRSGTTGSWIDICCRKALKTIAVLRLASKSDRPQSVKSRRLTPAACDTAAARRSQRRATGRDAPRQMLRPFLRPNPLLLRRPARLHLALHCLRPFRARRRLHGRQRAAGLLVPLGQRAARGHLMTLNLAFLRRRLPFGNHRKLINKRLAETPAQ